MQDYLRILSSETVLWQIERAAPCLGQAIVHFAYPLPVNAPEGQQTPLCATKQVLLENQVELGHSLPVIVNFWRNAPKLSPARVARWRRHALPELFMDGTPRPTAAAARFARRLRRHNLTGWRRCHASARHAGWQRHALPGNARLARRQDHE